jgi:hypothetical protein
MDLLSVGMTDLVTGGLVGNGAAICAILGAP